MNKIEFTPEETAKFLRTCCTPKPERGFIPRIDCESCGFKRSPATCRWNLQRTAADMIEAQAKRIGELEAELAKLREENRWIPVEERLPQTDDGPFSAYEEEYAVQGGEAIPYRVSRWKPMPKGSEVGHE